MTRSLRLVVAAVAALWSAQAFVPAPRLVAPRVSAKAGPLFSTLSPAVETT